VTASKRRRRREAHPFAAAIERGEWERIVLHVFVALAETLRAEPEGTIDDLIALLEARDGGDER
jgi:hypothetical protein